MLRLVKNAIDIYAQKQEHFASTIFTSATTTQSQNLPTVLFTNFP